MKNKEKDITISVIRFISLLMIISCHILQGLGMEAAFWVNVGVQMFFFISGYLYGFKDIENAKEFYINRLKRILIPYIMIFIIMLIIEYLYSNTIYASSTIVCNLLGLQSFCGALITLTNTWFISYILICYAITPLLQKINLKSMSEGNFIKSVLLIVLFIQILSLCKVTNVIAPWICNYVIGYYYSRYYKKCNNSDTKIFSLFITFTFLLLIFRIILQYKLFGIQFPQFILIGAPLIKQWSHVLLGCSICVILYKILSKFNIKNNFILKFSDKYSFYIYLVHQIFILNYFSLLKFTDSLVLNIIIIFLTSFLTGFLLYWIEKILSYTVSKIIRVIRKNKI